jgi:hypothetical protein
VKPQINMATPHAARVYDFYLGGKDHFAADKGTGQALMRVVPTIRAAARENRAFLGFGTAVVPPGPYVGSSSPRRGPRRLLPAAGALVGPYAGLRRPAPTGVSTVPLDHSWLPC